MSVRLKTVGVVVKDMAATLEFYRVLGLEIPAEQDDEENAEVELGEGLVLGFLTEARARQGDPGFMTPVGQNMNLQFECDAAAEVDERYGKLTVAGYTSYAEPWNAFWGQRFARVVDPDGRVVNLYAGL